MNKSSVTMLDAPERSHILAGGLYAVLCFFSLPFLLLLLTSGLDQDPKIASWFEIAFHVLNFIVVGSLFREYLADALLNAQIYKEKVITGVAIAVGLMLGVGLLWHFLGLFTGVEMLLIAGFGTVPLSEMDLFMLSADMVLYNKVFGTLCMVLLVPVTTSCLYYAIGFVPFYNIRPWLGYLVLACALAFPRVCNATTYWDPLPELILYLAQLPVHMIGAWVYKKTDSIWAPIASIAITNLISTVLLMIFYRV